MPVFCRPLAVAALLLAFAAPVTAADPAADAGVAKAAAALFDGLRVETLPNGLRVFLLPIKGAPVVTTMVAYKVGSSDEYPDQTGLSHYLEHLLFKGTAKLMPGDIDRLTQRNGGRNNAYTSEDMTVYHFDFAADRWQVALEVEADRMRNVRIDAKHEFEQEKGAVIAELKGNEDQPWNLEEKTILPLLFPKGSPYAHPVIGEEQHVRAATAEIIKRHYDAWYHPNNAALVVAGGFDPDQALALIKKLFGPIPKGDLPPRKPDPALVKRTAPVRKEISSKFDVPRMVAGFNTVVAGEPDDYVLDLVQDVLASGKTSRLYRRLVEGERLANSVSATNSAGRYRGWFGINVELLKGKNRAKAERIVFEELEKLAAEPITDAELKRSRRATLASFVFSRESVHNVADTVAKAVTIYDVDYLKTYLEKMRAVTPADVQRAAAKYLAKRSAVVVWTVPEDEPLDGGKGGEKNPAAKQRMKAGTVPPTQGNATARPGRRVSSGRAEAEAGGAGTFSFKDAKRVVLPNGLVLILLENHRLPVVVVDVDVADVRLREPAAKSGVMALTGDLLEEGTPTRAGTEISTLIEDAGGSLSLSSSGGGLKVLTPDTDLGLDLLFDCLIHPTFPAEAIERKREQLLSVIADVETQPKNRALNTFDAAVYGSHPYGRSAYGKRSIVEKLTAADLKAFHAAAFVPNMTTVVAVGDFDSAEMTARIERLTAGWKKSDAKTPKPAAPPKPDKPVEMIVSDPTAAQTHVYIGHLGIKRDDPDYYTLTVMDNVLGTGPGFTDRLSANLRDRQGLAYTVTAQIAASAADQPGAFTGYIGTYPDKYRVARDGFLAEIGKMRAAPPTEREVEDAKMYLLGSLPFRLTSNEQVAAQLLAAERFRLGFDFLETYRKKVAAVTPADVFAATKKHLDPARLVIVAVGPIGADGAPLPEPKK
ncbi:M16 family metallopeptidase [Fimbriiglobus ruber]|uniref:Peptidase, M16 family n=1 Tax=Fimbriiglobus ruber TaxID=1908690 RepID=A0A225DIX4_9BACT|nr:pitrilysin family protein [Fimbriiglobus ruber]OWK36067.1 peptidase, M16 family [Fimbriiglobus ruber]